MESFTYLSQQCVCPYFVYVVTQASLLVKRLQCFSFYSCTYPFLQSIDAYYSQSSGPGNVVIASVTCSGSEFRLTDCEYDDDTDGYSNYRNWRTYCRVG